MRGNLGARFLPRGPRSVKPYIVVPLPDLQRYLAERGFDEQLRQDFRRRPGIAISVQQLVRDGQVSVRTLRRDIRAGRLKTIHIARRVVVSAGEARRYIEMRSTPDGI